MNNSLDSITNQMPKYRRKTWLEKNNNEKIRSYDAAHQIKFKNIMLESS